MVLQLPEWGIIRTHFRRPTVLVVERDGIIKKALTRAPISMRHAISTDSARTILRRSQIAIVACTLSEAAALADAQLRSRDTLPPSFLLIDWPAEPKPLELKGRRVRALPAACDSRRIAAEVLALAHGWDGCDTRLRVLDDRLAMINSCGLVFFENKLISLLRMERLVFSLLARAPGTTLSWEQLAQATGTNQKHLYVSMSRMRLKFDELSPNHRYIQTQHAKGIALILPDQSAIA